MIGTYPILINGEKAGELDISKDGMLTRFDAVCEDTGEILRLSVYGECEGYLGVMQPCDGKYKLRKCMSRLAMRGFPEHPTFAGSCGLGSRGAAAEADDTSVAEAQVIYTEPESEENHAIVIDPEPARSVISVAVEPEAIEPIIIRAEPAIPVMTISDKPVGDVLPMTETDSAHEDEDVYVWQRQTGGALTCIRDGVRLLALPYDTPRLPVERIRETREIEGTKYAIFKIEDGKIL